MLPFRYQLLGHVTVALMLAVLLNVALRPASEEPDIEQKARPFTTQSEMLVVTVAVYQDAPPQILDVQPLKSGRVSVTRPGPYTLALESNNGQTRYRLTFRVAFTMPGLHEEVDEARQVLVVPAGDDIARLVLSGAQGEATYWLQAVE